jgi:hypothetical protein
MFTFMRPQVRLRGGAAPRGGGGGGGGGRGPPRAGAPNRKTHLTLPIAHATGPLPLPPMGGEGDRVVGD